MDTNEILLRIAEALEREEFFPKWETIIQLISMVASWVTIIFLLRDRIRKSRPYLQVSFELVRSSIACIVLRNVGDCPLVISSIKLSNDFVSQLPQKTKERVKKLEESKLTIFPKRFYVFSLDVITGTILNDYNIKKVTLDYIYKKNGNTNKKYKEKETIDFAQYGAMLVYISEMDELKSSVDKLVVEAKEIKKLIPTTKISDTYESIVVE